MLTRRAAVKSLAVSLPFLGARGVRAATGPAVGADWEKGSARDAGYRARRWTSWNWNSVLCQ